MGQQQQQQIDFLEDRDQRVNDLRIMANRLRRHSLEMTAASRSGHPTTCMSCADLMAALFFYSLRFDLKDPKNPLNDRFILSKGHAAPALWAALAEAGAFPVEHLQTLRRIDSDLEGHPTPRNRFVDIATGSLGQGLSAGVGMALNSKTNWIDNRIWVLLGDGEIAEGAVWEAASLASWYKLDNLVAIVDINAQGQSQRTMFEHDLESIENRFKSFGWQTYQINGHEIEQILEAYEWASHVQERPAAILAWTEKGRGVSFLSDQDGWHGKPVMGEDLERALRELEADSQPSRPLAIAMPSPSAQDSPLDPPQRSEMEPPAYGDGDTIATRKAYGVALRKLGAVSNDVFALDGDTKNSTYSQDFQADFPQRFIECYIAEQNMVGVAAGLSAVGKVAFASTFAAFLTRAYDQIRMAAISRSNLNLCGSHAGVSIGEDGPSQMGLEDLAMMRAIAESTVFYPSDGVSAERIVALAAETPGICYIRTTRPATPILYSNDEPFAVGGSKVVRRSDDDRVTLVGAGITLHEALAASDQLQAEGIAARVIDLYCVKPVDAETLRQAARDTGCIVTVEDHYPEGGLGDAVLDALADEEVRIRKLAVTGLPQSGAPEELRDAFGISRGKIVAAVKELLG